MSPPIDPPPISQSAAATMVDESGAVASLVAPLESFVRDRGRTVLTQAQRDLLARFDVLPPQRQRQLQDFADFLVQREASADAATPVERPSGPPPAPEAIVRPEQESVIKAMRRLTATYPMLERSKLLNETSALMAQHVMQGRAAKEVIEDLEGVFKRHYERFCVTWGEQNN